MQLELIEGRGLFQDSGAGSGCPLLTQRGGAGTGRPLLAQMGDALAERQMQEKLDKTDQIAAPSAAVAIEQIFAGIHIEGRAAFLVQGTQPHPLLPGTGATRGPVVPLQVIQPREDAV